MPRFEKGSKEAMAWAAKMKKAREAKKQMKGGMLTPDEQRGILDAIQSSKLTEKHKAEAKRNKKLDDKEIKMSLVDATLAKRLMERPGVAEKVLQQQRQNFGRGMKGGYLQPGEVPLSSTNEGLVAEKELYAPREIKSSEFMIDEEGGAMCKKCKMCGGAMLSNPDNQYVPPLQSKLQKSRFDSGEVLGGKMLRTKSGLRKKKQLQIVPGVVNL